ncbi:putative metalloprotease CJM1_0395 family protein [Neisseriaceae bacterium TC5R-5]|nr:putative metalloprotease CJM1_0395 family protein [Neisseriaceae bacterium TC5R-5]
MNISNISGNSYYPAATRNTQSSNSTANAASPSLSNSTQTASNGKPLTEEQQQQVTALKARDAEVHRHEQAHLAAGGSLTGGAASYSYQTGPDGKKYAIGGEVSIRLAKGSTPQETIANAQTVQRAALAPSEPSGQDRAVAAAAAQLEQQARTAQSRQPANKQRLSTLQDSAIGQKPEQQAQGLGSNIDTYA